MVDAGQAERLVAGEAAVGAARAAVDRLRHHLRLQRHHQPVGRLSLRFPLLGRLTPGQKRKDTLEMDSNTN